MNEIVKYINDNLDRKITQAEMAAMAGYSVWHFCEKFKAFTGCTFSEYLTGRKMQAAVKYLLEGRRIVDISESLGYTSTNGFKKAFMKEFGILPAQYVDNEAKLIEEYRLRRMDMYKLSDRCSILRRAVFHSDGSSHIIRGERMYNFVKAEQKNRGQPAVKILTEAICSAIENFHPFIAHDELIVGYSYDDPIYETTGFLSTSENDIRALRLFLSESRLTAEQTEEIVQALLSGYDNSFCDSVFSVEDRIKYSPEEKALHQNGACHGLCISNNHFVPDFEAVLKLGFSGILGNLSDYPDNTFYNSLRRVCAAACLIGMKYADEAEKLAKYETGSRRDELLQIAETCRNVPKNPAYSFRSAIQSILFAHIINTWEDGVNANSLGRLDILLYPYYKHDIDEGKLAKAEAFELICCLWLKLYTSYDVQQCTIGGYDSEGNCSCNELSYMMLDAMEELDISRCISVRYNKKTDRRFLKRAFEILRHAQKGMPSFFNDDVIIPALTSRAIPAVDAMNYSIVGCVEPTIPGSANQHSTTSMCNLLKVVEYALNSGVDMVTGDKCLNCIPPRCALVSFTQFMQAVKDGISHIISAAVSLTNKHIPLTADYPLVYKSLLCRGCTESGRYYNDGGAKYNYYQIMLCGFPNLVDSLVAVKKAVYDDGIYTLDELYDILDNNFRLESVHRYFTEKVPKYGNGINEVSELACALFNYICNCVESESAVDGGLFHAQFFSYINNFNLGKHTAATPDGRRRGDLIADGMSPMPGCDFSGYEAYFNSLCSLPCYRAAGTVASVVDIDPYLFTENNIDRLLDVFINTSYKGLSCTNFNIVDLDVLREAVRFPEKYSDLTVNVSGFSQQFVTADAQIQRYLIKKTKHRTL